MIGRLERLSRRGFGGEKSSYKMLGQVFGGVSFFGDLSKEKQLNIIKYLLSTFVIKDAKETKSNCF